MEEAPKNYAFFRVDVSDLQGGHSGDDIDKGRVNSNKTVARLLWDGMQSYELKLSWFDGGNLRNAIPREAYAIFGVPVRFKDEFIKHYKLFAADLEAEFRLREPNFKITLNENAAGRSGARRSDAVRTGLFAGGRAQRRDRHVVRRAGAGRDLHQPRFGQIRGDDRIVVTSSQRSSVESAKTYVMQMVESVFALAGADVAHSDGAIRAGRPTRSRPCSQDGRCYKRLFGADPKVRAIHAGLECGLFSKNIPNWKWSRSADPARRALARRTARNRHGSQILGPAARSAETV